MTSDLADLSACVFCQFTVGVAEEQQDMILPTTKSLRQRRCGHCLLQVRRRRLDDL